MNVVVLVIWCASIVGASHIDSPCQTPDHEAGTCIPVDRCSEFEFLKTQKGRLSTETTRLLQTLNCGYTRDAPLICCKAIVTTTLPSPTDVPDSREHSIITTTLPSPTYVPVIPTRILTTAPDVSKHRNIGLINEEFCGLSTVGQRIINGNVTEIMEYPWMALLEYRTRTGYKFLCGGTLINVNYVLTAAHCISSTKDLRLVRVRLGEHDYSTEEDCQGEGIDRNCAPPYQSIDVRSIKYPLYSKARKVDDIGLLRLATPANTFEEHIRPICLPVKDESTRNLDGLKMIVAGWGATETGFLSPKLLKVSLDIMSNEKCQTAYTPYNTNVTDNQICAGGSALALDSCKGDSGGPLMSYGVVNSGSRMIQYGIVSFGFMICGTPGMPGVYTRVTNYMDWILNNIEP